MRVLFGVIAAALLAGCGGSATNQSANSAVENNLQSSDGAAPGNTAAANTAVTAPANAAQGNEAAAASTDTGWAGDYEGDLIVEIRDGRRPGNYRVEISTNSGGGCMGVVSGAATASGDRMAFVGTDAEIEAGGQCRITLTRRGRELILAEGEGCTAFHGAMCGFDGSATRR